MYFDMRLFALTAGVRLRILATALVGLLSMAAGVARLAITGSAMALLFQSGAVADVAVPLAAVAALIALRGVLAYFRETLAHETASAVKITLRERLYRHALQLGPGYFDQQRTGGVLLSLVEGVERLETFFGQYLPQVLVASATPVLIFAFMVFLDVQIAFIFLGFALFTLVAPALFHTWNRNSSQYRRDAYAALGSDFLDSVQGLGTLKSFGQSKARGLLLAQRARHLFRTTMFVLAANIGTGAMSMLGISAGAAVALGVGALRVSDGTLELRTLVIVLMLGVEVFRPLRDLTTLYHQGMIALSSSQGIFALLDTPIEVTSVPSHATPTERLAPEIRFDHVSFGYLGGQRTALRDVSFTLAPGERLGLVGPSGAGKSTVVWTLLRFFDPQEGRVVLGGRDLRDIPLATLREQIAVVAQDTYLFHGTVAENLRLAKPSATDAELESAARSANAHDFITELPQGYQTMVGERGVRLSGGQRQRIAIARALLKDAPVLVLDEALSSVDSENEAVIQQALNVLMKGRTTLIIAHRLSSVVDADRIVVLDSGQVAETGTHQELVAAGGVYANLMALQRIAADTVAATATNGHSHANGHAHPHDGHEHDEDAHDHTNGNGHVHAAAATADHAAAGGNGHAHADGAAETPHANGNGHAHSHPTPQVHQHHAVATPAKPEPSIMSLLVRLVALVRPWWVQLTGTFLLGLAHHASVIAVGVVSALVVAQVATHHDPAPVLTMLAVLVPLSAFLTWAESWQAHDLAYRLLAEMRIDMYNKLEPLAPAYLVRRRTGDLVSIAGGDVETIELFFAHTITPTFVAVLVPGAVLVSLALLSWPLALALTPFLVAVGASPFAAAATNGRLGGELRRHLGTMHAHMVDSIQGMREVVAFGRGDDRAQEITRNGRDFSLVQLRFLQQQAFQSAFIEAMTGFGGLAVLTAGAMQVGGGGFPRYLLPMVTLLSFSAFGPVAEMAKLAKQLSETFASARRVFEVHDEPVPVTDGPGVAAITVAPTTPAVAFDDVTFNYGPGEPDALEHVSFTVMPGQVVALVGRSGAGKSTCSHLVLRFWDPQHGQVRLFGHDAREYGLEDLRKQIAIVAQDTYLFNGTIRDNLCLANPEASDAELRHAARLANAHDFITALPDGYDTRVGERGVQLSGGQRQRIAIARALLKDSPLLILDEATAHLDAANELQVRQALERLQSGRTTIVIAHRLSTVRDADRIVVLDGGHVAEQGTHDELLARRGVYAHLVASQLVGLEPEDDEPEALTVPVALAAADHGHGHSH